MVITLHIEFTLHSLVISYSFKFKLEIAQVQKDINQLEREVHQPYTLYYV